MVDPIEWPLPPPNGAMPSEFLMHSRHQWLMCRIMMSMPLSFLFVADLNGHHQEWLGSMTTNPHGVAVFHFTTVSGCDQLVGCPTHVCSRTLDLLITDVSDLLRVAVVVPIGNSDHSSLLAVILMAQAVPNMRVSRKVFLKHQVNYNTVWCNTGSALAGHLTCWQSCWRFEQTSVPASCMLCTNQGHPCA